MGISEFIKDLPDSEHLLEELKKATEEGFFITPFFPQYYSYNPKMVGFAGWYMPVQYSGLIPEHQAVRNSCGLFDVSHMGEIVIKGEGATDFVDRLVTNKIRSLNIGEVSYTPMCRHNGTIIDDLLVYKTGEEAYLLVVNASNKDKDYKWILEMAKEFKTRANIQDESDLWVLLALQGPMAAEILSQVTGKNISGLKPFSFVENIRLFGLDALISRTGYTGEDGFEIYIRFDKDIRIDGNKELKACGDLWNGLLKKGEGMGLLPAGLGARDSLRFEAKLLLYGQDIDDDTTPLDARIAWSVDLEKPDFIGKESLLKQKEEGCRKKLMGFRMVGRGIPRHGYKILDENGNEIGIVTSGTHSPTLKEPLGLGYVPNEGNKIGDKIFVQIRDKAVEAAIVKTPFYKSKKGK